MASIEIAILVAEDFVQDDSDLVSLTKTLNAIYLKILEKQSIWKPVSPYENLWDDKSLSEKTAITDELRDFLNDVRCACKTDDAEASAILRANFGDRFPLVEEKRESVISTYSEGPKPWANT